jgi:xylose isomerase
MRNYLLLRRRVRAFRADPEVRAALDAARVDELTRPTLGPGETLADLREERHDPDSLAERGLAFEALDQLAMEHLLGAR